MGNNNPLIETIACQHCDTLAVIPILQIGESAICHCCGSMLAVKKKDPIERSLALSLTGILLLIPAVILPIMTVGVAGQYNQVSLIDCLLTMAREGHFIIAFTVFIFLIVIPTLRIVSIGVVTYSIQQQKKTLFFPFLLNTYQTLDNWAMIHVFFLGVIVAMYKLLSLAELNANIGLLCLLLLLLCSTSISITFDQREAWHKWENIFV